MTKEELARKTANAYKREWARQNPERIKAAQMRYWLKKAAEAKETETDGDDETHSQCK